MTQAKRFYYMQAPSGRVVHMHFGKLGEGEKIEFLLRRAERAFLRNVGKKIERNKTRHETGVKSRLDRCL